MPDIVTERSQIEQLDHWANSKLKFSQFLSPTKYRVPKIGFTTSPIKLRMKRHSSGMLSSNFQTNIKLTTNQMSRNSSSSNEEPIQFDDFEKEINTLHQRVIKGDAALESELKEKLHMLQKKLVSFKERRKGIISRNELLYSSIKDYSELNERMSSLSKISLSTPKSLSIRKLASNTKKKLKKSAQKDLETDELPPDPINKEKVIIATKLESKSSLAEMDKNELNNNLKKLEDIEATIVKLKIGITKTKTELYEYYHTLIVKGIYATNDGISHIIAGIWKIGKVVDQLKLPNIFDESTLEFIYKNAKLLMKLDQLYAEKKKLMKLCKAIVNNTTESVVIQDEVHKVCQTTRLLLQNDSVIEDKSSNDNEFRSGNKKEKNLVATIDEAIQQVRKYQTKIKNNERIRITREFKYYGYEKKYHATYEQVLSALYGEQSKIKSHKHLRHKLLAHINS